MKSCKKGHYYCYTESKCKKIPSGYRVGMGGYLRKEREDEKQLRMEEMSDKSFKKFNKDMHDTAKAGGGASQETQNKYALELARRRKINNDGTVTTKTNENVEIQNSDGQTTALVIDIVGPSHMKPVINNGVWKGTQQVEEGAYKGGGIIINPSGSRNQWGLPGNLKPSGGGIQDVPLTPTQNRLLVKTVNTKKGIKTQLAHYDLKGDQIDEFIGGRPGDGYIGHPNLDIKNPLAKKQDKKKVIPNSQGGGLLNRTAAKIGDRNMEINKLLNQSFDPIDENVAVRTLRTGNTFRKALGAVLAAKGGEKILKDLLGTPDKPKDTDWVNNPKDRTDDELNVRSNQVKDAEKHKNFDDDMKALRRGKNLSPEEKVQRLKDAKSKRVQEQTQEPPNLSAIRDIISGVANQKMNTLVKSPSLQNLKKSAEQIVGTGKNEGAPGTLSGMAKTLGPQIKKDLQKTGMDMFKDIYKQVGTKYNLNQHYNMQEQEKLAPSQQNLSTLADRKKIQKGFDNLPQFMPKTTTTTKNGKTSTSSTMVSREAEMKRQLDKEGPIHGVKVKMDSDGNVPDAGAFAKAQISKGLKNIKPNSKFSASDIETAKRFNQNNTERNVNSANPGSWQFRANIATDEINQSTQKYKKGNPIIKNKVKYND